jgi:polypyrimidine tract-binding protein 1
MAEEGAAISMVNYFSSGTSAQLRGRNVFVQYSNHSQLKTDQSHSNAVSCLSSASFAFFEFQSSNVSSLQSAAAQAALQAAQALAGQTETQGGPNTVLRVIVEHMVYPVTLDVLFQVSNIDVFRCFGFCRVAWSHLAATAGRSIGQLEKRLKHVYRLE